MKTAAILLTTLLLTHTPLPQATHTTPHIAQTDDGLLTPQQVQQTAKDITVRITAENNGGSGVIIAQKGDNYLILTNAHVVRRATKIEIQAPDGKKYPVTAIDGGFDSKYDLALLQFTSTTKYTLANLSSIAGTPIEPDRIIYSAGFPFDSKDIRITTGKVSQLSDIPFDDGTQLGYVTNKGEKGIRQGMSGGAIFDAQGNLLGINTIGIAPILPNYTYNDGSKPIAKLNAQYRQANWGIPIYNFLTNVKPDILYGYANLPKVERQVTPTGYMAKLNDRARQMTVRIENSGGNGSGVIVAKEGSTYYVLTAKHVFQNPETQSKHTNHQIITYDQDRHSDAGIVVAEGVDLAVVKFTSNVNYPVAQLGEYSPNNDELVFVGGYPGRDKINSPVWQWQLNPGFTIEKETGKLITQDNISFSNGYDLIYSSISYGGMSGGPVFDTDGKVIGIHGKAEGPSEGIFLGGSLGISTQSFTGLVDKFKIKPSLLNIAKNNPAELNAVDRKAILDAIKNVSKPQQTDSGSRWLTYANQLTRTLQFKESVVAFDRAIAEGEVLDGNYGKTLALIFLRQLDRAEVSINKAIAVAPTKEEDRINYYHLWKYKAIVLIDLGRYDEALKEINTAIKLQPQDMILGYQKARLFSNHKKYPEAIAIYDDLIRNRPDSFSYFNRGLIKLGSGDITGAMADVNQAIAMNPKYIDAYLMRSTLKLLSTDMKSAIPDLDRAINLNPNYSAAYWMRGTIKIGTKDYRGGIPDLDRTIELELKPKSGIWGTLASNTVLLSDAYSRRAGVKFVLKDYKGAIDDCNLAIKINPTAESYLMRAGVKFALEDYKSAIDDCNLAIKINPVVEAYYFRGAAQFALKDFKNARIDITKASQLYLEKGDMTSYQRMLDILKKTKDK